MREVGPMIKLIRAWRARPTWAAAGRVLTALPMAAVTGVVTMFAVIYTAVLLPVGIGFLALPLLRAGVRWRVAAARRRVGDGAAAEGCSPPREGRVRGAVQWALGPSGRREVGFLLADAPIAVLAALLVLGVFYLIGRALLELSFLVVWPSALHGAWGGSVAGALVVHCGPGVVMAVVGPRVITWAASLRPRTARALVGG